MDRSSSPRTRAVIWLSWAPSDDFVLCEIGNREFFQRSARRVSPLFAQLSSPCDPRSGGTYLNIRIALRRGVTVVGRLVGPDDQPVPGCMDHRHGRNPTRVLRPGHVARLLTTATHSSGRFQLHGLDPDSRLAGVFFPSEVQAPEDGPDFRRIRGRWTQ